MYRYQTSLQCLLPASFETLRRLSYVNDYQYDVNLAMLRINRHPMNECNLVYVCVYLYLCMLYSSNTHITHTFIYLAYLLNKFLRIKSLLHRFSIVFIKDEKIKIRHHEVIFNKGDVKGENADLI